MFTAKGQEMCNMKIVESTIILSGRQKKKNPRSQATPTRMKSEGRPKEVKTLKF